MRAHAVSRLALALAVLATGVTVVLSRSEPASAAIGSPLVHSASARCLDLAGGGTASGVAVQVQPCAGTPSQSWELTAAGELRVFETGTLCLDVPNRSTRPGTALIAWTCNGGTNQQWRMGADGAITGVQSGLCLSPAANGPVAQVATCTGAADQRWTRQSGDATPPSAPAGLAASDLTCRSVTLSWTAATDDTGVAFYDIFHDGQQVTSVAGTATTATLTVVPGAPWGWYVNARDAAGNVSQASDTVTVTPPQCQVDSEAPTAPGNLRATVAGTTVTLTWSPSTDNEAVTGYIVFRGGVQVGVVAGGLVSFIDSGLAAGTTYSYRVTARDAQGNTSPPSATVSASTGQACANPVCAVTQLATDTDIPWGLVTLPDGSILYARRDARDLVRLNPTTRVKTTVGVVPDVAGTDGEGGLMGLAVSPSFATDRWLYIMHTTTTDNRVVRIRLTAGNVLETESRQVLVSNIPRNKFHNGGRLRWGPDGKLYVATGDGQSTSLPQNLNSLAGKILRVNPDGTVPADNPFGNYVWSYGHRNPQGIAFDSQGRLWEQEFGNSVMDETNLITRGGNYGWPSCEGTSGSGCSTPGFIAPKHTYTTASGSCSGIAVVRDALYIACARGARLYRAVISGSNLTNVQQYFAGTYGRLRTVEPAPDGGLWLTTTNSGDKDSVANNSNERILHVQLGG
ncbi:MAG TPA: PQQ-dependent sugar dehydrogenase [Pilimelia sp.]|nr:PQQ-dependent sugar dehydrogenase [Pilimelia sp.]